MICSFCFDCALIKGTYRITIKRSTSSDNAYSINFSPRHCMGPK
jgi:hypothetical protein